MARKALIHQLEAAERRGRWFPALAGLLVIAMLASTWIGLFAFMGTNAAYGTFDDLQQEYIPDTEGMTLGFPDLSRVSRVYASGGELLAELHDGRITEPTPIDEIPELVINAVLAAEDSDFYEHDGVDFRAIASAAIDNILYDQTRGGSTITQQLTKNLFVGDEVTIRRKINEAFVAAELERRFTKDQILEFYLNSVFFGANAYGITAAAHEFFDKELDELQVHEAATLAVLVRNPTFYNPRRRPADVGARRDAVIGNMEREGWITETQAERALRQPLGVRERGADNGGPADFLVAEVTRLLLEEPEFSFLGDTRDERKKAVFGCPADDTECTGGGGLTIETTLDLEAQQEAVRILTEWMPVPGTEENLELCKDLFPDDPESFLEVFAESNSCSPTGAIATIDNATGAVIAVASGLPFSFNQFDLAIQGRRNPGSSFKPITAVAALETGDITLGSFYAAPQTIEIDCPGLCNPNPWKVSNAGGTANVRDLNSATSSSVNTVYAQVAVEVGPDKIVEMARRMGITTELDPVPSLTLGAGAVSPLEMASAYTNFATNGRWTPPYIISRIVDDEGTVVYEHERQYTQVADPAIFAAMRDPLSRVPTSAGTAARANINRPQGGKTGTHQNYQDAWYVGYTPQYSTAVWVGYASEQIPLRNVVINGETYARVFGGSVPAPIWAEFMSWLLADQPAGEFPEAPPGTSEYFKTPTTIVPSVVGLDVNEAVRLLREAKVRPVVEEVPSSEPEGMVLSQSPEVGAEVAQGSGVVIEVSTGVAPVGQIPDIAGVPISPALDTLRQFSEDNRLELTIVRVDVPSRPQDRDRVIDTDPGIGSTVEFGDLVRVYVGTGNQDDDDDD